MESVIKLFADDTKLYAHISLNNTSTLPAGWFDKLIEWTQWGIRFNIDKCKVMHVGSNTDAMKWNTIRIMNQNRITVVANEKKDLGAHFDITLKFSVHCAKAAAKANSYWGWSNAHLVTLARISSLHYNIYKSMVRTHMEYNSCIWSPRLKKYLKSRNSFNGEEQN